MTSPMVFRESLPRRHEAVAVILDLAGDDLIVAANGMIGREAFDHRDRPESFYMIGSMGLASTIGLGVALARPERRVTVLDGDGNLLMALGHLAMVAEQAPTNLLHVVLDNRCYASTGGQRSISDRVALDRLAAAAGYRRVERCADLEGLGRTVEELRREDGPSFLLMEVAEGNLPGVARVSPEPAEITRRFRAAALS